MNPNLVVDRANTLRVAGLATVLAAVLLISAVRSRPSHNNLRGFPAAAPPAVLEGDEKYVIGQPRLADVWVDPVAGDDSRSGASPEQALKTLRAAWEKIPSGTALTKTGYRIQLMPGAYPAYDQPGASVPGELVERTGTPSCPVIIQSSSGPGKARLPGLEIKRCRHVYFIDLWTQGASSGGDGFHLSACDHILIRNCDINGNSQTQEVLKANQCQNIYVEDSHIRGPTENVGIDFVAVQYGHILRSQIHDTADWGVYLKGGSAYFLLSGNEIYNTGNGGFTAGQGTGFEYMVHPWLHYEAYDIKFVNNVVHDTDGAGMGVNGGYNILLAYNTLFRIGKNSHAVEVVFGGRGCEPEPGHRSAAQANHRAGGWGRPVGEESRYYIPNKNIFIYNNIICNPPPYQSQWQHFATRADTTPPDGANAPNPCRGDDNLQIKGNFIWNGPADLPLGIGGEGEARLDPAVLRSQNSINRSLPQLVSPERGDFRPIPGGNVYRQAALPIPDFEWSQALAAPAGTLSNRAARNRDGTERKPPGHPGAY